MMLSWIKCLLLKGGHPYGRCRREDREHGAGTRRTKSAEPLHAGKSQSMGTTGAPKFRDRDGVCIQYEVRGFDSSELFPYRNDIATLKEAVGIARSYPGIYGDGSATHVYRRYSKRFPPGHEYHHRSGYTHCWRVSPQGELQLLRLYRRDWPTSRLDPQKYAESLPPMVYRASTLQGQLVDLGHIAQAIGLHDAAKALSNHAYGRAALPFAGQGSWRPMLDAAEDEHT